MKVRFATPEHIDILTPTLLELRPHLDASAVEPQLRRQLKEGYQLIFVGNEELAFSLAGFRTLNMFVSGKTLYIDDLVTHPDHMRKGYATVLLDWIKEYAKSNHYETLSLDSGFDRKKAYPLYLNSGLEVAALHFGRRVSEL